MEVVVTAYTQKLHATLHNTLWRVTVAVAYAVGERAVVDTYSQGRVVGLADVEQRHQPAFNLLYLLGIFLVGVANLLELSCRVYIVAGINPHLLGISCSYIGNIGIEVYVGDNRREKSSFPDAGIDVAHVLSLTCALRGEPHQLASSLYNPYGLLYRSLGVVGVCCRHRLYAYGVVASHAYAADIDLGGLSSVVLE